MEVVDLPWGVCLCGSALLSGLIGCDRGEEESGVDWLCEGRGREEALWKICFVGASGSCRPASRH